MIIEYNTGVLVPAGWRSVTITAKAEQISAKRVRILEVLKIDGEEVSKKMSRTGAKRQQYSGNYVAENEISKIKFLSKCYIYS